MVNWQKDISDPNWILTPIHGYFFIEEDFGQPLVECPIDLRKLYTLIRFNVLKRYEDLMEFFKMHNYVEEMNIVETKLNVMKQTMKSSRSNDNNDMMDSNNSSALTNSRKRKHTADINTGKSVRKIMLPENEESP